MARRRLGIALAATAAFSLSGATIWLIGQTYLRELAGRERSEVKAALDGAGSLLGSVVTRRVALLSGLEAFAAVHAGNASIAEEFLLYAQGLKNNDPAIRAVQIFPSDGRELIYPEPGNEPVLGGTLQKLLADERPTVRADVQRAIRTRSIALSDPYELRQGGLGLVARQAIFKDGRLWGMAVIVLDVPPLFALSGISATSPVPSLAVKDRAGRIFFGHASSFSPESVSSVATLPEGGWTLAAPLPREASDKIQAAMRPLWLAGFLTALGLGAAALIGARRYYGLREEIVVRIDERDDSQRDYREIFEFAAEGIFVFDEALLCVDANPGACALLGRGRDEIVGRSLRELFGTGEDESPKGLHRMLHKDGESVDVEIVWRRHADGRLQGMARDVTERNLAEREARKAELETRRLLDLAQRSRMALLSVAEDQKRAEDEVRRLNASLEKRVAERTAQLEKANQEMEAFTYSVSHDLRAPLRAIDGFSSFLLEGYAERLDDEGRRLLEVIRKNAQRMGQLIADLLDLSRISRFEMKRSRIDMGALAASALEEVAEPAVLGTFAIDSRPLPGAWGDPALLRQVWVNLLSNAVKYSMKSERRRIEIGGAIEGREAVYHVRDEGAGFDPEYASKLFGVFQRLHKVEEFEGTGVGLALAQRILARHGGRAWAAGKPGEGATFYFSLPIKEDEP
jgi:PAS domain S-box-containing protein